jgi:tyrosyl-tRNA synthetase
MSIDILRQNADIFPLKELEEKLKLDRPLRIKLGIDPTAPDIHLGHYVVLRKLRQFQDLGHKAILIIGEFTAYVGDPSGRDKTRPVLTRPQIKINTDTYIEQASRILDTSSDKLEIKSNRSWFDEEFSIFDFMELAAHFTAQQLWQRNSFKNRAEAGVEVGIIEFLYPMFQAYDSWVIGADVELGGSDQTFNLLRGRDLMAKMNEKPQVVMTMPLLVGLDGSEKMSKSKGNHIGIADKPNDMFGKIMSISDELMLDYFQLLTNTPRHIVQSLDTHPKELKVNLAHTIVSDLHNKEAADLAQKEFDLVFSNKQLPSNIEVKHIGPGFQTLPEILVKVGFADSKTKARRLIQDGAVKMDGIKESSPTVQIQHDGEDHILQVGKKNFCILKE